MHTATIIEGPRRWDELRFRTLDALARRLGGTGWQIEHGSRGEGVCIAMILRAARRGDGHHVVERVKIPSNLPELEGCRQLQ